MYTRLHKSEFFYQTLALLLSTLIVHTLYVGLVRPNADAVIAQEQRLLEEQAASGITQPLQRSAWVVLKDYEQEACFILALWAIAIIGLKAHAVIAQQRLLRQALINIEAGRRILPEDARKLSRSLEALPSQQQKFLLPRALRAALLRYSARATVAEVAALVRDLCTSEADRLDSELSLVRYITWVIPSIGFIGTVRGIGAALGNAHKAVAGDISAVTSSLGVAFNSTFVALLISILIMFLTHQITLTQERLVMQTQDYCNNRLLSHLQV